MQEHVSAVALLFRRGRRVQQRDDSAKGSLCSTQCPEDLEPSKLKSSANRKWIVLTIFMVILMYCLAQISYLTGSYTSDSLWLTSKYSENGAFGSRRALGSRSSYDTRHTSSVTALPSHAFRSPTPSLLPTEVPTVLPITTVPLQTAVPTVPPPTTVLPTTTVPLQTAVPTVPPPTTVLPTTVPPTKTAPLQTAVPTVPPPTTVLPTTVPPTTTVSPVTTVPPTTVPLKSVPPTSKIETNLPEGKLRLCKQLKGKKYLLSAAPFGPNNQIAGIKEAAVLAKATNRTFILPYLRRHYSQTRTTQSVEFRFKDIFDIKTLESFVPVIDGHDLLECGWNTIDQVVVFGSVTPNYMRWHAKTAGFAIPEEKDWTKLNASDEKCNSLVTWAKKTFATANIVMLTSYKALSDDLKLVQVSNDEMSVANFLKLASDEDKHKCAADVVRASGAIHLNPTLKGWADDWIQEKFGENPKYLAIHMRPYPDKCVNAWFDAGENGSLNKTHADSVCSKNLGSPMFNSLGKAVTSIMKKNKIENLFIMSHPKIIDVVKNKIVSANISESRIFTFPLEEITVRLGNPCSMRHLFVEEYIAITSSVFAHTLPSSIGMNIALERTIRDSNASIEILQDFIDITN